MNARQVAARFGCTEDQARAQFQRNAEQLQGMASCAAKHGKVNGFTAQQLAAMAAKALTLAKTA